MTLGHLRAIHPAFDGATLRTVPYTYFADASMLEGEFTRIVHPDLELWHSATARLNLAQFNVRGRRVIKRVVPLEKRQYREAEIRTIKHCLHFQLALGLEVQVVFTQSKAFLEEHVESANVSLVAGFKLVRSPRFWDPEALNEVEIVASQSIVGDLHAAFRDLETEPTTIRLWYDRHTFTNARLKFLKRKFGNLLYTLQNGRCARTSASLDGAAWDIDHIVPRNLGGNNSLVNLQAVLHLQNVGDSDGMKDQRFGMKRSELTGHLAFDVHRKLSDRTLVGLPLGNIHSLDFRAL
jgi:hypothetical protein